MPSFLETESTSIAYHKTDGRSPGVVFLGGFKSDMDGTKALHLETWAKANNRSFLRFDYGGHGKSSGDFLAGSIGEWAADAINAITLLTDGPQILVGSSMGGWISLLVSKKIPERIAGFVGIAAAPDFTEDSMWAGFSEEEKRTLTSIGQVAIPSDYSPEPYIITKKLIEDGRKNLVLRDSLKFSFPVRLLQGTADTDVDVSVAQRLFDHIECNDIQLSLFKDVDHRFSSDRCLRQILLTVEDILSAYSASAPPNAPVKK